MKVYKGEAMYKLDNRELEIVRLLSEREFCTADELAKQIGSSEKTVRTIIKNLNDILPDNGALICSRYGKGYSLEVSDQEELEAFLGYSSEENLYRPNDSQDRLEYLLYKMLSNGNIDIKRESENLFVSERSIRNDLNRIEEYVGDYRLKVDKHSPGQFGIIGSEVDIRLCAASLDPKNDYSEFGNIKEVVTYYLKKHSFELSDIALDNLIHHIIISIIRIRNGNFILTPLLDYDFSSSVEFRIATDIAQAISKEYGIVYSLYEMQYIAIHLMGKKSVGKNSIVVSNEIDDLISDIFRIIKETFNQDFTRNFDLRISLCLHFEPMINRLKFDMCMDNPLLDKIRENYPYAYTMALAAGTVISKKYGKELSEGEIGYIALSFELALEEEKKRTSRKKNVLLLCNLGRVSSTLLQHRYQDEFGDYINRIDTCSLNGIDQMDLNDYDLIISTVPLRKDVSIPVIEVTYFSSDDQDEIIKQNLEKEYSNDFNEYFSPRCFISGIRFKDKNELLKHMCNCLKQEYHIEKDIYESVLQREEMAATDYVYKTALPHTAELLSERSHVCVCVLDEPMQWTDKEVQLVFLISIGKDKQDSRRFYTLISKFLLNKKMVNKLIKNKKYDELINMMKEIEV